ncbi:MAG: hypothetical protein H0U51_03460 [Propionibacteriales bacterium]|nr:hypothetical protein [Propionibacteriales bacterium]
MSGRLGGWTGWALLLMVVSLGLPWSSAGATAGTYLPGYLSPSYCYTNYYDGTMDCTYSSYSPGFYLPGYVVGGAPGYATAARVFIAVAFALVLFSHRQKSQALLTAALVTAAASVALVGGELRSGPLVLLASISCLLMARQRSTPSPTSGWQDRQRAAG